MLFRIHFRDPIVATAVALAACYSPLAAWAQRPPAQPNAAEILHKMQKLQVLGSVLYIVAHPDDENTRLIAWLANGKKVRTGDLSLTRGDGGQNLIGPELGDALGIIRTQELLEARRIDGGEQFFTRAVDFGYSKSAEESFQKWGKQEVLSDVVRVIRMFRPDVIITRFPPTREAGHGHHEASAILAAEAFDLAGDPNAFPEQLTQGLEVWQPRRLFFNGSTWWKQNLAEIAKQDSGWYTVDVGGYDPLLGLSYTEIAGRSRSMHKSQGFGAAETRGEMIEYLHLEKGDKPKTKDIFEGIDMTWSRIPGAAGTASSLQKIIDDFQPERPEMSIAALSSTMNGLRDRGYPAPERAWVYWKEEEIRRLLLGCAGISIELTAKTPSIAVSETSSVTMTAIAREMSGTGILSVRVPTLNASTTNFLVNDTLQPNKALIREIPIGAQSSIDEPYWLAQHHSALYTVKDPSEVGRPATEQRLTCSPYVTLPLRERANPELPIMYKWVDRVAGERIRPVYVTPIASIVPEKNIWLITELGGMLTVHVDALKDNLSGTLTCSAPKGWMISPPSYNMEGMKRGERRSFTFQHVGSNNPQPGSLEFVFTSADGKSNKTMHEIDYPHIMPQVYYTPADVKMVPLDVKVNASLVGYIKGAGDEVPQALEQLGVAVEMIDPSTATLQALGKYDAIVTGIRAYNTVEAMKTFNATLLQYVKNGGTLVCQYNTRSSDMMLPDSLMGPYPFKLTRDRVTVEEAPATFLTPTHPLLNTPNKITATDFEGWVQERGLYFTGSLDPHYTPLIAWNDPGEQPLNGALISCDYGKGRYVYTGISFFRELPAGVPGAYRLFANLISRRVEK
ncbi:MAG: PIG-L family deacetylase [Flavobacteriales bacterium]